MKSFYILDVSGFMNHQMIVHGKHIIQKMIEDNQEIVDQDTMVFEWTPVWGHLKWLVDDLKTARPEANIWFVGDRYGLLEEDVDLDESINVINVPSYGS
jgi:hypothetical protein